MNLEQIKKAIEMGERVYWEHTGYEVLKDSVNKYFIKHYDGHIIGLVWDDGVTINGKEDDFFIWYEREVVTEKLVSHEIAAIMRMGEQNDFAYLSNILRGEGFTQYGDMTIQELNDEWHELVLFDIDEERV